MHKPDLEKDYQQYILDCARNWVDPLSFKEWLAAEVQARISTSTRIAMLRKQAD